MNILLNSAPKGQKANSLIMGLLEGNIAPKGQQANSPGHRPGYEDAVRFALKGRRKHTTLTQGVALGWELTGLSGRQY